MSTAQTDCKRMQIVVLGGGFAGFVSSHLLDSKLTTNDALRTLLKDSKEYHIDVIMISQLDGFHYNVGGPRALVDKKAMESFIIPMDKVWPASATNGKSMENYQTVFIHASVKQVEKDHVLIQRLNSDGVVIDDDEKIKFDYLVGCLGSNVPYPFKPKEFSRVRALEAGEHLYSRIKEAKVVVVVGAGATGVETVFEVKEQYPSCRVILVDPNEKVMHRNRQTGNIGDSLQNNIHARLKERGIETLFGESVEWPNQTTQEACKVKLSSGKEIESDVTLVCVGIRLNLSPFHKLVEDHPEAASNGALTVNDKMQLKGYPNIFIVGDLVHLGNEGQLAYSARLHGAYLSDLLSKLVVAKFLTTQRNDEEVFKGIAPYTANTYKLMLITTGRFTGFLQLTPGLVLGNGFNWIISRLKSRDMMFNYFFGQFGVNLPYKSDFE